MNTSETEVPPLEAMPDIINKIQKDTSDVQEDKSNDKRPSNETKRTADEPDPKLQSANKSKRTHAFGGMKKGFLFGSNENTTKKKKPTVGNSEKLDLSSKKEKEKELNEPILNEFQQAMRDSHPMSNFQRELAKKIDKEPVVSEVLSDPLWLSILDEFQNNTQLAMIKYQNNKTVKNTIQKLCAVLGDNFLNLPKTKNTEEEDLVKKLIDSPVVKESMMDEFVNKVLILMKRGENDKVNEYLNNATPEQRSRIQIMVDHGLITYAM